MRFRKSRQHFQQCMTNKWKSESASPQEQCLYLQIQLPIYIQLHKLVTGNIHHV